MRLRQIGPDQAPGGSDGRALDGPGTPDLRGLALGDAFGETWLSEWLRSCEPLPAWLSV